jgi:hypothetical protein
MFARLPAALLVVVALAAWEAPDLPLVCQAPDFHTEPHVDLVDFLAETPEPLPLIPPPMGIDLEPRPPVAREAFAVQCLVVAPKQGPPRAA